MGVAAWALRLRWFSPHLPKVNTETVCVSDERVRATDFRRFARSKVFVFAFFARGDVPRPHARIQYHGRATSRRAASVVPADFPPDWRSRPFPVHDGLRRLRSGPQGRGAHGPAATFEAHQERQVARDAREAHAEQRAGARGGEVPQGTSSGSDDSREGFAVHFRDAPSFPRPRRDPTRQISRRRSALRRASHERSRQEKPGNLGFFSSTGALTDLVLP